MSQQIGYSFKEKDTLSVLSANAAFADASVEDLRVLTALILTDCQLTREQLCKHAQCDAETLTGALQYWRGAGVLVKGKKTADDKPSENSKTEAVSAQTTKSNTRSVASLDKFSENSSDKLAREIEKQQLQSLIEACQQIVGKTLST